MVEGMTDDDFPDNWIRYRWGFEAFRTARRYGLGIELHVNGTFLVGLRLGPWYVSWGQQIVFKDNYTSTRSL